MKFCGVVWIAVFALNAQLEEIGPAPLSPAAARQQVRDLLKNLDAKNRSNDLAKISGLLNWYRDIIDDEAIAA